jgi:hypothetical protein
VFLKILTRSPALVRTLTSISTLAILLLSLGACVTRTDVSDDEDNTIGESRSALGETACNTQSCTAANSCSSLAIPTPRRCYYSYASYTTPSSTYGSAVCPKQYTIKVTGSTTTQFSPYIEWGDVALSAATCPNATLTLTTFQKSPTTVSYTMSSYHGVWRSGILNTCEFVLNSGSSPPPKTDINGQTVRLAGSAMLSGSPRKVTVGLQSGDGPC